MFKNNRAQYVLDGTVCRGFGGTVCCGMSGLPFRGFTGTVCADSPCKSNTNCNFAIASEHENHYSLL
jgi:hypothetical protein